MNGKVVLITGASSGIGAATAVKFAKLECKLALSGRNIERLNKTKNSCMKIGNLKDSDVNNAGINVFGCGAGSDPIEHFDKIINTNVRGVIQLTQMCLPYLKVSKGSIVNVSSMASSCPFPSIAYYCMSKAALDSYTQCLALEVAKDGVRVNSVKYLDPLRSYNSYLYNENPLVECVLQNAYESEEVIEDAMEQACPLGRMGEPHEIARAISFLASDDSSFITGQNLNICGGFSITTAGTEGYKTN